MHVKVFLSHAWGAFISGVYKNHECVKIIKHLVEELSRNDRKASLIIRCWLDEEKLRGGDQLTAKLASEVEKCDVFVFFVDENYQNKYLSGLSGPRDYCSLELQTAVKLKKPIIPVIMQDIMKKLSELEK